MTLHGVANRSKPMQAVACSCMPLPAGACSFMPLHAVACRLSVFKSYSKQCGEVEKSVLNLFVWYSAGVFRETPHESFRNTNRALPPHCNHQSTTSIMHSSPRSIWPPSACARLFTASEPQASPGKFHSISPMFSATYKRLSQRTNLTCSLTDSGQPSSCWRMRRLSPSNFGICGKWSPTTLWTAPLLQHLQLLEHS